MPRKPKDQTAEEPKPKKGPVGNTNTKGMKGLRNLTTAKQIAGAIWVPQPGPQTMAVCCPADIILFGGARGGGKSDAAIGRQLIGALQHGEAWNGLFIRRHFKHFAELRRRWDELIRAGLPAKRVGGDTQTNYIRFENGAKVTLTAFEAASDIETVQGHQYCVAKGTRILMADGSPRNIEDVKVGDLVATMEGARSVTRVMPPREDLCVIAKTAFGQQLHPYSHPLFSASGWKDFASASGTCSKVSELSTQEFLGLPRVDIDVALLLHDSLQDAPFGMMPTVFRTSSSSCAPSPGRMEGLKSSLSDRLRTCEAAQCFLHHSERSALFQHGTPDGFHESRAQGSRFCCLSDRRLCGGQPLQSDMAPSQGSGQGTAPSPGGEPAPPIRSFDSRQDALGHSRPCSRRLSSYLHPYTGEVRPISEVVVSGACSISPYGFATVYDLTVDKANHYISYDTGLVNKNTEISIEEACQFSFLAEMVDKLKGCMRSPHGVKCHMFLTANPGGPGHTQVKNLFKLGKDGLKPGEYQTERTEVELFGEKVVIEMNLVFIPSKVEDNKVLCKNDPVYVAKLMSIKDPKLRAMWLDGDWDMVAGGFFDDVWEPHIHVLPMFHVPKEWDRVVGFDWGSAKPFAVVWFAVSNGDYIHELKRELPKGALVMYREWYGCVKGEVDKGVRLDSKTVAKRILEIEQLHGEGDTIFDRIADPAIFKHDDGPSIDEKMGEVGVVFRRGDNRRISGWDEMRGMLRHDPSTGDEAMLFVLERCTETIRTVPVLFRDDNVPDDIDTTQEDHIADAIRYVCMSRQSGNTYVVTERYKSEVELDHDDICAVSSGYGDDDLTAPN